MTPRSEVGQLEVHPGGAPARRAPVLAHWYVRVVAVAAFVLLDLVALGLLGFSERVRATALSTVVPGLGLFQDYRLLSVLFIVGVPVLLALWLRWGIDWVLLAGWAAAPLTTFLLFPSGADHTHVQDLAPRPEVFVAAHEVTWLMAVFALIYWIGLNIRRIPIIDRAFSLLQRPRPDGIAGLPYLSVGERARAAGLFGVAQTAGAQVPEFGTVRSAMTSPDVTAYARRLGAVARGRFRGDPLARDHAGIRAARLLCGATGRPEADRASREGERAALGMIPSEPGWVRLVDGALMGAALQTHGQTAAAARWRAAMDEWFPLHKGKRPSSRHTALGFAPFSAQPWEHAAATAVLLACGWIDPQEEWPAVRRQSLGAVGRGGRAVIDKRLVAAGRCWALQLGDEDTLSLLARVSPATADPIAMALEELAGALERDPLVLRKAS